MLKIVQGTLHIMIRYRKSLVPDHDDKTNFFKALFAVLKNIKINANKILKMHQGAQCFYKLICDIDWFDDISKIKKARRIFQAFAKLENTSKTDLKNELKNIIDGDDEYDDINHHSHFVATLKRMYQILLDKIPQCEIGGAIGLLTTNHPVHEHYLNYYLKIMKSSDEKDFIIFKTPLNKAPAPFIQRMFLFIKIPSAPLEYANIFYPYNSYDDLVSDLNSLHKYVPILCNIFMFVFFYLLFCICI